MIITGTVRYSIIHFVVSSSSSNVYTQDVPLAMHRHLFTQPCDDRDKRDYTKTF